MTKDNGVPPSGSGCQPTASAADASSQSGIPNAVAGALLAVVEATRDYLPPDGISAQECLSRILAATDNPTINPIIREIEQCSPEQITK